MNTLFAKHNDTAVKAASALANGKGGIILIGVDDKGCVVGVTPDEVKCAIDMLSSQISPSLPYTFNVLDEAGKSVLLISIWEGANKPYTTFNSFFVQEGDVITRATLEQVDSLFEERRIADDAWERMPNAQADFNDLSKTVNDSLKEQLLKLNRCDSNATMVDVCKYMFGAGGAEELISVRLYDGNLVESIEEITQYIASLYPTRIEIAINLYADCVQIINTGELMKPLTAENLPKKHISILRNPDIANAFFILRYIEMAGSGIQRIINECNRNRCETPVWKSENGQVTLTFPSVYHNQTAVRKRDWKSLTTKLSADETVKKSLAQILDYISLHKRVKLSVLSELTGKSYPTVKRYMQTLKDAGLVTYEGNNRSGGWSLSV